MRRELGLLLAAAAACTEVGSDPQQPVAIAFDTLPAPAIAFGDTLRDLDGVAAPLTARAFNVDGDEIVGAPIEFFSSSPTVVIDPATDVAVASADTTVRTVTIRAQAGGIPSATTRTLERVFPPDTVDRAVGVAPDRVDTLYFLPGDTALTGPPMVLRVLHRVEDPANPDSLRGVKSWRVRYAVAHPVGGDAALADTLLVDDANRLSTVDTTAADGGAARRIRVRRPSGGAFPDSIAVDASAWFRAAPIPGAPVRFILLVRAAP